VQNILSTVQSDSNKVLALQLLVTSTRFWHLIKLQGKPVKGGEPKDRDGLRGALAKLASANSEGELKGALGEIHDAIFFSRRFGMVTMDQTKTYNNLIPGQYLDTVKSKQMDLVFSHGGFTHYVETKFDVTTAIGKHAELPNRKELLARAEQVRKNLPHLALGDPVKVEYPKDHPLARLPEVSQQLLGYDAVALERTSTKGKKIVAPQQRLPQFVGGDSSLNIQSASCAECPLVINPSHIGKLVSRSFHQRSRSPGHELHAAPVVVVQVISKNTDGKFRGDALPVTSDNTLASLDGRISVG
jgi:hypothetical protein